MNRTFVALLSSAGETRKPTAAELAERRDLRRARRTMTIDPVTAKVRLACRRVVVGFRLLNG